MNKPLELCAGVFLLTATLGAQNADISGDGMLQGDYFVREVLISNQNQNTGVISAASATGIATFDGKGNFTFAGQVTRSAGGTSSAPITGTYQVGSNGLMAMTSLAAPTDVVFGGVAAVGPSAFVASATEGVNVDIMIAIPAGSNATNSSLTGSYAVGTIDYPNSDVTMTRQAKFTLSPNGAGSLGTVSVAGSAENLGNTPLTQTVSGATYTLSGEGSGTANFGTPSTSQLLSGTKTLYISKDGNIILGGSPTGYDLFVGIRSLSGTATNATANSLYYIAGFENSFSSDFSPQNQVDAFYGSANSNGNGTTLFHNRLQNYFSGVYDYTFDAEYTVQSNGTISPADLPWYQFTLGAGGQAFIATGNNIQTQGLYTLVVGFAAPNFSGTGVYLKPTGIVNSGSFSPITNPIAPNEFVTLFGSGLANSPVSASNLPLPKSLGGVTVTVNGQAAPLLYVSQTQIEVLVPSSISPGNQVFYATFQVTNNNVPSNSVTVYTSNSSPGVFTLGGNGIGPAAAQHANFTTIGSSSPATTGETIIVYANGLGAVTSPPVPDGAPAPSSPLDTVLGCSLGSPNCSIFIDVNGVSAPNPAFAGLTPTAAGLYQINVVVPAGTGSGPGYFDISTFDAYASQSTVNISSSSGSVVALARTVNSRPSRPQRSAKTASGLKGRAMNQE